MATRGRVAKLILYPVKRELQVKLGNVIFIQSKFSNSLLWQLTRIDSKYPERNEMQILTFLFHRKL